MKTQYCCPTFLSICLAIASISYTSADEITLIPEGGFATGANINALAGPLFSSALDSVDIGGSGSESASAMLAGNFATHIGGVELDFSGGGTAFFDSVYDSPFSRTATLDHRASAESIFHFAVDVPTEYEVMGSFGVVDDSGTTVPGNVELEIELLEFDMFGDAPAVVFYNYQVSKSSMDAGFMVGGTDGDTINVLDGAPVGILDPSKVYRYRTLVTTNAIDIDGTGSMPPTDGGATAMGGHTILFSAATAVPEPSTGCLIGFAILLTPLARRRRR